MSREKKAENDKAVDDFKTLLIAHHPERAEQILEGFEVDSSLAPALSEEELEIEPGYNAAEIESAIEMMKRLGFASQWVPG